ncbi:hypothetical protein [Pedobacter immunditicola]|uniref:hypothetical protein n=1 Tax=Pedobacter immunditicola TaxID=3133440 RepID=UPI0030983C30
MYNSIKNNSILCLIFISLSFFISCDEKDEFDFNQHNKVAVTTSAAQLITKNEVTFVGEVNTKNNADLTEIGFCYSTNNNPTTSDDIVLWYGVLETGPYQLDVKGLKPSTNYYYRAFAKNKYGTAYGEITSFNTERGYVAQVQTLESSNITRVSADVSGGIIDNGGYKILNQGICYSATNNTPTINNDKVIGELVDNKFKTSLTKLIAGSKYYARAFVISELGTSYGQVLTFTTASPVLATGIITNSAGSILPSSATLGGSVAEDNGSPIITRGICYSSINTTPTISNSTAINIGNGTGTYSAPVSNLQINTTYYFRAFATNGAGTAYGSVMNFRTSLPALPSNVSTTFPSNITMTSASTGGSVTVDGGGSITARGVVYSNTTSSPTISNGSVVNSGTGLGGFTASLNNLQFNTTYYVRAFATNEAGITYGTAYSFKTSLPSLPSSLTTYSVSNINSTSAYFSAYIGNPGGGNISDRGFVYSNSIYSPTLTNGSIIKTGTGVGSFNGSPINLTSGATYYVRSYATNEAGTTYGSVVTFTTIAITAPTGVTTYSVSSVGSTNATLNGYIGDNGGSTIIEKGFVYSSSYSNPNLNNSSKTLVSGTSVGTQTKSISGLTRYTTYYVKAYATNAYGTTYGATTASFYTN